MTNNLQATSTIEIPLNKKKILLMTLGSFAFVAAGFWFVTHPDIKLLGNKPNPVLTYIIGFASIIFFGICSVFIFKKLFDTRPGMIITGEGIIDNSSATSVGLIPWADIEDINVMEVGRQKLIMILVYNPEDHIARQTNPLMKKIAAMNYRMYKTPISVTANSLQCDFEELYRLLKQRLEENA